MPGDALDAAVSDIAVDAVSVDLAWGEVRGVLPTEHFAPRIRVRF